MIPQWLQQCILLLDAATADTPCLMLIPVLSQLIQTIFILCDMDCFSKRSYLYQMRLQNLCQQVVQLSKQELPPLDLLLILRSILFGFLPKTPAPCTKGEISALRQHCHQYAQILRMVSECKKAFATLWTCYSLAIQKDENQAFLADVENIEQGFCQLLLSYKTSIFMQNLARRKVQTMQLEQQLSSFAIHNTHQKMVDKLEALTAITKEKEIFLKEITDKSFSDTVI